MNHWLNVIYIYKKEKFLPEPFAGPRLSGVTWEMELVQNVVQFVGVETSGVWWVTVAVCFITVLMMMIAIIIVIIVMVIMTAILMVTVVVVVMVIALVARAVVTSPVSFTVVVWVFCIMVTSAIMRISVVTVMVQLLLQGAHLPLQQLLQGAGERGGRVPPLWGGEQRGRSSSLQHFITSTYLQENKWEKTWIFFQMLKREIAKPQNLL